MNELVQVANDGYNAITSKVVRRTVVYTSLLAAASTILYGIAVIGYIGFYHDFVPHQVRTTAVHLQYPIAPAAPNSPPLPPFGLADLTQIGLKTSQDYDVSVALSLPRSPGNLDVGNFMVELALASRGSSSLRAIAAAAHLPTPSFLTTGKAAAAASTTSPSQKAREFLAADGKRILFAAARPALLEYTSPLVDLASRLLFLPLHMLAPAEAERIRVTVPMAEALSFGSSVRGGESKKSQSSRSSDNSAGDLPAVLFLEIRSASELRTYGAEVVFEARLRGLRRMMYHQKVLSFVLMTTVFWAIEVLFMVLVFLAWSALFGGANPSAEYDDLDAPSLPPPYQPAKQIKHEESTDDDEFDETTEGGRTIKAEEEKGAPLASIPQHGGGESSYDEGATEDSNDDDLEKVDSEELVPSPALQKGSSSTTTGSATASSPAGGFARFRSKAVP